MIPMGPINVAHWKRIPRPDCTEMVRLAIIVEGFGDLGEPILRVNSDVIRRRRYTHFAMLPRIPPRNDRESERLVVVRDEPLDSLTPPVWWELEP